MGYSINRLKRMIFLKSYSIAYENGYDIPPPGYVIWDCTRRCNLKCVHCGAAKESYKDELSTDAVKKLIDELADMNVKMFAATGGEPLTRRDILEVMTYASMKGMKTGIATNGFLIDGDMARGMKDAGIDTVQISLDGPREIHNMIRGNARSFDNATGAVKFLKGVGLEKVAIATTATPLNISYLSELKGIIKDLGVDYWKITIVMPIGRAAKGNLLLSREQFTGLLDFVQRSKKDIHIEVAENLPFLGEYDSNIRSEPALCPVGFSACCIGVDGHARGCPEQPDTETFREGTILEQAFSSIWKNGFKKYRSREILEKDKRCRACKDKYSCFGGCWVMREGNNQCIHDLLGHDVR